MKVEIECLELGAMKYGIACLRHYLGAQLLLSQLVYLSLKEDVVAQQAGFGVLLHSLHSQPLLHLSHSEVHIPFPHATAIASHNKPKRQMIRLSIYHSVH